MHEQPKDVFNRFRYNLDAYQIKPMDFINRYEYKLGAYGIDAAKKALYRPGRKLGERDNEDYSSATTVPPTDDMHNNFSIGRELKPDTKGKPPISGLGTPVFADVILSEDKDETKGVQLISCLVIVTQTKNIAKTAVAGRSGTDKEYMSDGDYVVKLKGNVTRNFENNYPKEEMNRLIQLLQSNKSLKVVSKYMLQFQIHNLIVESYTMGQQSVQNQQAFEINCVSDTALILEQA